MIQPIVAREEAVCQVFFSRGRRQLPIATSAENCSNDREGRYWGGRMTLSRFYLQDRHSRSRALVLIADVRTCVTKEISDLDFVGANDRLNENTGHRFFSLARLKEEKEKRKGCSLRCVFLSLFPLVISGATAAATAVCRVHPSPVRCAAA